MKKLFLIAVLAMLITTVCKAQNPGGVPISILPAFTDTLKPADVFPIVHGGATRRSTIAQLATAIGASGPVGATGPQGATGPTGDSHWTIADSLLYLNDTIYYVGVGTNSPQYQLDVKNSFNSTSNYARLINGTLDSLYDVPFIGIYKRQNVNSGIMGLANFSSLLGNEADSAVMFLGFTEFNTEPNAIMINPGDSSIFISAQKYIEVKATDSINIKAPIIRLFDNCEATGNVGDISKILISSGSLVNNNTAINGSSISTTTLLGASTVNGNYVDGAGRPSNFYPGIQYNILQNNCHIDSNAVYGSSSISNINNASASNSRVTANYLYNTDTVYHVSLNNLMQRANDNVLHDSIYGYQANISDITQLGNSELNNNKLSGSISYISMGLMCNSHLNNCKLYNPNQHISNFTLFNSNLSGLNNYYSVDRIYFINKDFDLSSLTNNLYNTTWIGDTTKIDNLQMQGKLVFNNIDSAAIYALPSPVPGETYYCTDCTPADNSAGGVKVCYNGSLWRREW